MSATRPILARGSIALPYAARQSATVARLPGAELDWLRRLREQSLARVVAEGVPSPRVESWKYTNLNSLAQAEFEAAERAPAAHEAGVPAAVELPRFLAEDVAVHRMVFVNGSFRRELSDLDGLPEGASAESLADVLARAPQTLVAHFEGRQASDGLAALNTALMADGVVLRLAPGTVLTRPLLLLFLGGSTERAVAFHPRSVIVAEAGSQATIVELHAPAAGDAGAAYWSQPVTDIVVGDNAELRHYKCQQESLQAYHLAATTVRVGAGGRYDSFALAVGGILARNEVMMTLDGPGASCRIDGGFLARGRQHVDTTTEIVHAKPNATSHEAFKGVLDGQGRAVFQGRIVVAKDAQKTDGHQSCRTLLLSDRAEIDTKPELEIYADDVKCSHGATVGELEQDALFYLQTRGIPESAARRMLVEAFLGDVIETIADAPVRDAFARVVSGWLADDGAKAAR
jgi:Fe-S cluster assembly protein SufD